jgi:flagellar biosynthetic protein FliR
MGLGLVITFIVAPTLPPVDASMFSSNGLWLAIQQLLIGIALGFTMQFAFATIRYAGELIGLQMGLSFATFVDPTSHLNMPVLARLWTCWRCCCSCAQWPSMADFNAGRHLSYAADGADR